MTVKEKVDELDFIQLKTYAQWKTLLRGWKDKPQTGQKDLQISNKELISRLYKEFLKLNKKHATQLKNW